MKTQTISIVIRALNEAKHLPNLLSGISEQSILPDEVILVDSGSTDRTIEIASEYGTSLVYIQPEDFTFGRSLNVGCEYAGGDILVFVSAHVYPSDKFWLEKLTSPFVQNPELGLVYGRQIGDERSAFSETEMMRQWFPMARNTSQEHPFCNNANCAIRRRLWEQNKYDETITGLEDMAWAKWALQSGHRIWYEPDSIIVHVHEETRKQIVNRYMREAIAHKKIFGQQKLNILEAVGLFFANVFRDYLAAVPRKKLKKNLLAIPTFRFAQFKGAWLGFRQDSEPTAELKKRFYYPKGFREKDLHDNEKTRM